MLWSKKRETDIEMEGMRGQKKDTTPDDTDYRPINWKRILFSPKYIRMRYFEQNKFVIAADKNLSLAHPQHINHSSNCVYNNKARSSGRGTSISVRMRLRF